MEDGMAAYGRQIKITFTKKKEENNKKIKV